MLQMIHCVANRHTLEVVDLATTQNRRQDLMLLCGSQNENDVCGGLLQCLQECVEGCCGEHMYLVDDKHFVSAKLRRDACLLHQGLDMLHRVVRGGIKLEDVQRALLVKRLTAFTFVTGLTLSCRVLTVDSFGKDTCTGGFSHTSRTAKQVSVCQLAALYGILQRGGQSRLSHDSVEGYWTVFPC